MRSVRMLRPASVGPCLFVASMLAGAPAFADATSDQCIDANTHAQLLRKNGKLVASREQLASCADARCPAMVRNDCAQRLDELNKLQPTIVFDAKDGAGADVMGVTVTVDGHLLTQKLDGSPLSVDPGPHTFQFDVAGQPPLVRTYVLKEGEKGRVERVVVGPAPAGAAAAADATPHAPVSEPAPPASATEGGHGLGGAKIAGIVLAVVGAGGVAAGTTYGLLAQSAWNRSKNECGATCSPTGHASAVVDHSTAVTDGTVSTVGFAAGGALLVGGIILAIAAPSQEGSRSDGAAHAGALQFTPTFGPGAAGLDVHGLF